MSAFFIRADGNHQIGLGHVMRCLSLADVLRRMGHSVCFIVADQEVVDLITGRGYEVFVLDSDYQNMEGELSKWNISSFFKDVDEDIYFVVDSYYVSEKYFADLIELKDIIKGTGRKRIVYFDDLEKRPYPVDVLVNYNVFARSQDYYDMYKSRIPHLILGMKYAPLREMFYDVPLREQRCDVKDVLVSAGGADPEHLTFEIVERLRESVKTDITYHVLVGRMNRDNERIHFLVRDGSNILIHEDVSDMRGLISSCDIAISAAGSTLYEICACGVPVVTYALADNQIPSAEAMDEYGVAVNCGDLRESLYEGGMDLAGCLLEAVAVLGENYDQRVGMGRRMQEMIDGRGAERLALELTGGGI